MVGTSNLGSWNGHWLNVNPNIVGIYTTIELVMDSWRSPNMDMSHGRPTHYMVDGHPIHNKDPELMVIINPYEPLDD